MAAANVSMIKGEQSDPVRHISVSKHLVQFAIVYRQISLFSFGTECLNFALCVRGIATEGLSITELVPVMSDEELKAELERLRNENAALKKGASTGIRMKVSEKGAVSIYGMGRFPVTLYKEQWLKLLDMSDDIRAFIATNEAKLKTKN